MHLQDFTACELFWEIIHFLQVFSRFRGVFGFCTFNCSFPRQMNHLIHFGKKMRLRDIFCCYIQHKFVSLIFF